MQDDINKIYEAALESAEAGLEDYHNDFDAFIDENNVDITVPVEWLDFAFLFEKAIKKGFVVPGEYGPLNVTDEFDKEFGQAAPYLLKFVELSFRAIIRQCIAAYIGSGFVRVSSVDDNGNLVYDLGTSPEDEGIKASINKMLEFNRQWNNVDGK